MSSRRPLGLPAALLALALALSPRAQAEDRLVFDFAGPPAKGGLPAPWTLERWSPVVPLGDFVAEAKVITAAGRSVLHLRSADSGFLVGRKTRQDMTHWRRARWTWKAEVLPRGGDFRQRSTNDQALQLLFGFEGGRVLGYLWDNASPQGASGSGLSWREDVRVIVLRSAAAPLGQWQTEERDLHADFRRLFGEAPPALLGLAIQTNSQHTDSTAAGAIGPIELLP